MAVCETWSKAEGGRKQRKTPYQDALGRMHKPAERGYLGEIPGSGRRGGNSGRRAQRRHIWTKSIKLM